MLLLPTTRIGGYKGDLDLLNFVSKVALDN